MNIMSKILFWNVIWWISFFGFLQPSVKPSFNSSIGSLGPASPLSQNGLVCQVGQHIVSVDDETAYCLGQTSDTFKVSFIRTDPNLLKPVYSTFVINEFDPDSPGNDTAEFVEVLGPPNTSLKDYVLVFFNGGSTPATVDIQYRIIDLDKFKTDDCGYFLVRGPKIEDPHPMDNFSDTLITIGNGFIQNGQDAIALYHKASYPFSLPTSDSLVDAVVYDNQNPRIDTVLLDSLNQTIEYRDNTASSLARIPNHSGLFTNDSTPTPGAANSVEAPYHYIWLLTSNDTISDIGMGDSSTSHGATFTFNQEGEFCVYGLSFLGTFEEFSGCHFLTISEIMDSISSQAICASLSMNCQDITVQGGFKLISATTNICTSFDENGTYQLILKWKGLAAGPFSSAIVDIPLNGSVVTSADTSCFISDPIPGGTVTIYRLYDGFCQDTLIDSAYQFCNVCASMTPPDQLGNIPICESGPFTLSPSGGGLPARKPAADLFFSEYVEGSGFNKCLELYNATNDPIDLSAENYVISIYFNGDTITLFSSPPIELTGIISPWSAFVICDNQAAANLLNIADQIDNNVGFNGDDAIVLTHNGKIIDVIGQVGFDPGSQWGSGLTSTQDNSIRRKSTVCSGDSLPGNAFDPSIEWQGYPIDDSVNLGKHDYNAIEYSADAYHFYDQHPDSSGVLLASGDSYTASIIPGTSQKIYYTAIRNDFGCESTARCVIIESTISNLICIVQANISLSKDNCTKLITDKDVLKNPGNCDYSIHLSYPFGTNHLANNMIDRSHLGYEMVYKATDIFGNSCWGILKVEDKAAAPLICKKDTISCFELSYYLQHVDTVVDACSGTIRYHFDWQIIDSTCENRYAGLAIQKITNWDQWNNSFNCTDTFLIEKSKFSDLLPPDNFILSCESFAGSPLDYINPDSLLSYQKLGIISESLLAVPYIDTFPVYPVGSPLCNLKALYNDEVANLCGNGMIVRREWRVLDWCTFLDTIFIQYLRIEDTRAPRASVVTPILKANTHPHDCFGTITRYRTQNFSDCSDYEVTMFYSYADPENGRTVHVQAALFDDIILPVGSNLVYFTATDACGLTSIKTVEATVTDASYPNVICDEKTTLTVDPDKCWSRLYAIDLNNDSKDNCHTHLHFAIARMDSLEYWRNYLSEIVKKKCPNTDLASDSASTALVNHWINTYAFKDYLDLTACETVQIVLRAYEADDLPRFDDHLFPYSEHLWFCFNSYPLARLELNYKYFSKAYTDDFPKIDCLDTLKFFYTNHSIFKSDSNYLYQPIVDLPCGNILDRDFSICLGRLYNDCMSSVSIIDKSPPKVEPLKDLVFFCDGSEIGTAEGLCFKMNESEFINYEKGCALINGGAYLEIECTKENDNDLSDAFNHLGIPFGYYSCRSYYPMDDADVQINCKIGSWAPLYCRDWLCLDSTDGTFTGDITSLFYQPIYQSENNRERQFGVYDNCEIDSSKSHFIDTKYVDQCGTGWFKREWYFSDGCKNETTVSQKIIINHRSDFEVIFPEDALMYCNDISDLSFSNLGKPIISDDECEMVSVAYKDEQFDIVSDACFKIIRTWYIQDECMHVPTGSKIRTPEIIINDTLLANQTDRNCILRNLKDGGDGYMEYVQIIKVIDTSSPKLVFNDTTFCVYNINCESGNLNIPFELYKNCGLSLNYNVRAWLDFNNESVSDFTEDTLVNSSQKSVNLNNLPIGDHLVKLFVDDHCGNSIEKIIHLKIKDCKLPTPLCLDQLAIVIMPSSGNITVWAKDFNAGSYDNCSSSSNLHFSLSADVKDSFKIITCTELPNGVGSILPLNMYVMDEFGNSDHCSVNLYLQDGIGNICTDLQPTILTTKLIQNFSSNPVELEIMPNPMFQEAHVSYKSDLKPQISIFNSAGKLIKEYHIAETGIGNFSVKADELAGEGVYYIKLQSAQEFRTLKFVLIK